MENRSLHMIQVALDVPHLVRLATSRRLPVRQVDLGYIAHCWLTELFGDNCPSPFSIFEDGRRTATLLAYADLDAEGLSNLARSYAAPDAYRGCDWSSFADKPMPSSWKEGARYGFETRICPVVRMASAGPRHSKGAEVDAFLAECFRHEDASVPVDRSEVYEKWLSQRMKRGGASLLRFRVYRFRRNRLLRRTQGDSRTSHMCERPDLTARGVLRIDDPEAFETMLRRGVGRHRAFGFGMLLLRPEGSKD